MQVGQKTNKPQVTLTLVKWAASDFLSEADRLTVHDALTKASSTKTSSDCQVLPAMSFRDYQELCGAAITARHREWF